MGCGQSSAKTTPDGDGGPASSKTAKSAKSAKSSKNIDKKKADELEEEAKKRRSNQGKVENMVHEEFERGYIFFYVMASG